MATIENEIAVTVVVSIEELMRLNNLASPQSITSGTQLIVPVPGMN